MAKQAGAGLREETLARSIFSSALLFYLYGRMVYTLICSEWLYSRDVSLQDILKGTYLYELDC